MNPEHLDSRARASHLPWIGELPSLQHIQKARGGYHYLEELALCLFVLTPMERQVGHLMLQGLFYQQIAQQMFLSESAIKADARRIFAKVHVKDRRAFEQHIHALVESI